MQTRYDIVALGELLVDFTPGGGDEAGFPMFVQNPGGAPANLLVCASRLGRSTALVGKVGRDSFGRFLRDTLRHNGVSAQRLLLDAQFETTLAFVHLDEHGDREFSFYRSRGADKNLREDEFPLVFIEGCRVFHFGSLSLTDEPSRCATLKAAEHARARGKLVSYDPNWRRMLWPDEASGIRWMTEGMRFARVVKVSDEELGLLTGEDRPERGAQRLCAQHTGIELLLVTMGGQGSMFFTSSGLIGQVPAFENGPAVDTTGAGDCFIGALLSRMLELELQPQTAGREELLELCRYANRAAGICVTRKGGIPAMPYPDELSGG